MRQTKVHYTKVEFNESASERWLHKKKLYMQVKSGIHSNSIICYGNGISLIYNLVEISEKWNSLKFIYFLIKFEWENDTTKNNIRFLIIIEI